MRPAPDPRVVRRLHEAAPPSRILPFAGLERSSQQLSVFVPVLLGAGALLSAAAWLVERIGRMTAAPELERGLARQLESLALPPGGLLDDGADPFRP
jgi:hypothetical protein